MFSGRPSLSPRRTRGQIVTVPFTLFKPPFSSLFHSHRNSRRSFSHTMSQNVRPQTHESRDQPQTVAPPGSYLTSGSQFPRDRTYMVEESLTIILLRRSPQSPLRQNRYPATKVFLLPALDSTLVTSDRTARWDVDDSTVDLREYIQAERA